MLNDYTLKPDNSRQKAKSLGIAAGILVVLLIVATIIAVMPPRNDEPQIIAQVIAAPAETEIKIEKKAVARQASQASSSAAAAPVANMIRSMTTATIATPEVTRFSDGVTGLGEGGFGDGFGNGSGGPGMGSGMRVNQAMKGRCDPGDRMRRLRNSGANEKTEDAVVAALDYLKTRQNEDGSFGNEYPVALTGLALLAYLGHCETPSSPAYGPTVTKAAVYLIEAAKKNRGKAIVSPGGKPSYENPIATYALSELYSLAKADGSAARIPSLDSAMRQGVRAIVDGQDRSGGWDYGYRHGGGGDTSVSGWNFQALKAAYNTGRNVSGVRRALDKGIQYFKNAQTDEGGFAYKPKKALTTKPTLGGVGALAFVMWDNDEDGARTLAFQYLNDHRLGKTGPQIYSWYYTTQAYFMIGGEDWKKWNDFAMPQILSAQAPNGSFSLPAHGPGDPVYSTALCTLSLEVYYRYLPTSVKVGR